MTAPLMLNNQRVETDPEGYLVELADWNEKLAPLIAAQQSIELTQDHWLLINAVRSFYQQFDTTPTMRLFIRHLRNQDLASLADSITIMGLFTQQPMRTLCKIAGLPKPTNCL